MFLNAFKNIFTPKATKTVFKKRIRRKLELLYLEKRVVPTVASSSGFPNTLSITTASIDTFGSGSNGFSIDFVSVGNAGNPGDANSRNNYGSVPYDRSEEHTSELQSH